MSKSRVVCLCPKWVMPYRRIIAALALMLVCIGLVLWLGHFCLKQTRGFALYKIRSSLSFNPEWETSSLNQEQSTELKTILDQPFRFLDKGAQAYVFLSQDGRYVIKFFKLHSLQPPIWFDMLHLPYHLQPMRVSKMLEKKEALRKTFTSYKIAYEELKEETGIVFLHLNKSHDLQQKLTLMDNLNIAHAIQLDEMEFLVQKRASLLYPFIEKTVAEKGIESAKSILSDLVHFLATRNQKGIFDKDPDLATNFGIGDGKVMQIDVGRFRKDPQRTDPSVYHPEILRITDLFNQWLKRSYPPLSAHLEEEISQLIPHETH